jgi:glutamate decarboxylase
MTIRGPGPRLYASAVRIEARSTIAGGSVARATAPAIVAIERVNYDDETMRKVVKLDEMSPEDAALTPRYAQRALTETIPKYELGEKGMDADSDYQLIHDELLLDGSSRLNLATFVSTWIEPQAEKLMAECFSKNMIDKDEYPQTAEIEHRCIQQSLAALPRARGGRGCLDRRAERGRDAGRPLAQVALARAHAQAGQADRAPQHDHGVQRAGRVGEILPLLGRGGPLSPHGARGAT